MAALRMLLLPLVIMTAAPPASVPSSFLTEFAETRRYLAGRPERAKVSPDGKTVLFLRSAPRDNRQTLFEFDVASGTTKELLTPDSLLKGAQEKLSVAEKAQLERMRVSARGFTSFQLSPDGSKVVVTLSGKLYLVERASLKVTQLKTGDGAVIDPKFSPDGLSVGYVRNNDMHQLVLATNTEKQITKGGTDEQPNGLAEFVAQEEMSRFSGFWFSPDSKSIVYQHTDHRGLERFGIADPMHPEAEADRFYYPRPGKKNAVVTLGLIAVTGGKTTWLQWDSVQFPYLATVKWPKAAPLTLVVQNREQTKEQVLSVEVKTGKTALLLEESDEAWLNIAQDFPRWLPDGSGFFWMTERNGDTELELRKADGSLDRSVVPPSFGFIGESGFVGYNAEKKIAYVTASQNPTESFVWRYSLDGSTAPSRLASAETFHGVESAVSNEDASVFVVTSTSTSMMPVSRVLAHDGALKGTLESVAIEPTLKPNVEILKLAEAPGSWAAVIRPREFVAKKKYPVVLNVYAGPGHLEVLNTMRENLILQWLADQGFIVVKIDGRGTPRRDRAWERAIKNDFATITTADQVAGLKALAAKVPEMDLGRVGVYGWSFGGYMAALLALKGEVIKFGVAGAPVVDWLDYDTHYTERYLGVPHQSAGADKAYEVSSLLTYVPSAQKPFLLIHGTADDNVYFLHTLKLSNELFRAGKRHEVLPLSNLTHMVPEPLVMQRLWERIALAFKEHL